MPGKKVTANSKQNKVKRRKWTKESVEEELLVLHKKGCDLREMSVVKTDTGLVSAARRHYGSWRCALEQIGIPITYTPKTKWTIKKVQQNILSMKERGESLNAVAVKIKYPGFYAATGKLFGGYSNALESLGMKYADYGKRREWTKQDVVDEISELARGKSPLYASWIAKNKSSLFNAARLRFGSWGDAIEAAGIDYTRIIKYRKWTMDDVIQSVRRMYRDGERLDCTYVRKTGNGLYYAGVRYFGSWRNTILAAGYDYEKVMSNRYWNRKKIIRKILKRAENGNRLSHAAVRKEEKMLINASTKHFGSWEAAIQAAGFDYGTILLKKRWTEESVKKEILRLWREGSNLVTSEIAKIDHGLYNAGRSLFGSWKSAVESTGLDYTEFCFKGKRC